MQHVTMQALRGSVALTLKDDDGDPVAIVTKSLEDLQKAVDERLKKVEGGAELKALMDRLAELEKKANRPGGPSNADEQAEIERKALATLLRTGSAEDIRAAGQVETKAAASDNDPEGGYFVLPTVDMSIRNLLTDLSPLRGLAEVVSISTDRYERFAADTRLIPDPFGHGQRAVDFLRGLKHPKSRLPGKAFQLDPWQEEIVRSIYGPCDEHGNRIVQNVVVMVPRGNRKTSLAAALTLLHTHGPEAVPGGEVLFAAVDKKQAKLGLTEATGIIQATWGDIWRKGQVARQAEASSGIRDQSYKNRVLFPNDSFLEALSNDAGSQHGRTPVFALCDEIHAWKKRDLWDVVDTGLTKVDNSLRVTITTAGRGRENLAFEVIDYARKVAAGEIDDPSTIAFLYETPVDADWTDEKVWHRVNPGLAHGYPSLTGMRNKARVAQHKPTARDAFRQLHLNQWLGYSATPFLPMPSYDACQGTVDLDDLAAMEEPVWVGVDLSTNLDLTAIVMAWGNPDDGFMVHAHFFGPETKASERDDDGVPYTHWAEDGLITLTDGPVIDHRQVQDFVEDLCATYRVEEVAFDPKGAAVMIANLLEKGIPAVEFPQGAQGMMAPAIKELERAILGRKFRHGGNPILRWHFDNIAVGRDRHDNIYFHKGKSKDRIDGAVACAMAVGRCAAANTGRSSYNDAGDDFEEWAYV